MLFNWLYAKKNRGTMVLRLEDTDEKRNTPEAVEAIFHGLKWLGFDWQEGPDIGGPYGPYRQSERGAIYEQYLKRLQDSGRCYEDQGAVRFKLERRAVTVPDLVCGDVTHDLSNPGTSPDITIRRPDGSWIFHFVSVVDDVEMKISHVIRGEDHLSNTPRHIQLYEALGETPPAFAHIPLILREGGGKMSKRDKGASVHSYMDEGYTPEAVVNYLCLLGWSPKDNREILPIEEVIELFDLSKVNRRNALFDLDKCFWINGQYVQQMSLERFAELGKPWLKDYDLSDRKYFHAVLEILKEKIKLLSDLPNWAEPFFAKEVVFEEDAVQKVLKAEGATDRLKTLEEALSQVSEWTESEVESALQGCAQAQGAKTAAFVHPLRVAISGRQVGASLYAMAAILGKERVLSRIQATREQFAA